MIDEGFLGRVYKSSFYWSLLILSYLMIANQTALALGFGLGVALALGVLRSIETIVKVVIVPGGDMAAKAKMGAFGVGKWFILAVIVAIVVKLGYMGLLSLPAFACGIGIPATIMFLKTLSHFFSELEFHPFWGSKFDPQPQEAE